MRHQLTFQLRGIAEGVMGRSQLNAASYSDLLANNPALAAIKDKLVVDGMVVKGYSPCDG